MKKLISVLITAILLITFAVPVFAAQQTKLIVNGKTVTGITVKVVKNIPYIPMKNSKTVFGANASATYHSASKTVVVGSGLENVKKLKAGSTTRLFVNGKTISGISVPVISGSTYIPLLKVAQELGFKSTWNDKSKTVTITNTKASSTSNAGVESIKLALSKYSKDISLSSANIKTLYQYNSEFFAKNRVPLSLEKIAKVVFEGDLTKNVTKYQSSVVNLTFVEIDEVSEEKLSNGQTITHAIGHTGGKYNKMTETWTDSTYFKFFYLGSTKIVKGSGTTVNGLPIGQSNIDLVNELGVKFKAPMNVVVAGNLLTSIQEYDIRKERSENTSGTIQFPDEGPSIAQQALQKLSVTLMDNSLNITDDWDDGLQIKSIAIMDYTYPISTPFELPNRYDGGLTIPLSSFVDDQGNVFQPQAGEAYFIQIVTDVGEITRLEEPDHDVTVQANTEILSKLQNLYMGSPISMDQDSLVVNFSPSHEFIIKKITVANDFVYLPSQPISINNNNYSLSITLNEFKDSAGNTFKPTADSAGWLPTYGVTILTNHGELRWSF